MTQPSVSGALVAWKGALGETQVFDLPQQLFPYLQNVGAVERTVSAVIRPANAEEVALCVAIANQHKVPLYPFSTGKNWGLGSCLPVTNGSVLLDLSRLNRIREVNVRHHYAVVEPGVTQGQLYAYLAERKLPLMLNVTGGSPDASLIGNALERGVGYFSTKADSLSGMEIVLGSGTLLKTGFGHVEGAKTTYNYRHGIGPGLDGLFYQSNFGVVTSAAVDLIPAPECGMAMVARLEDAGKLPDFIDALVDLRQKEIIRTIAHIGNRNRTLIAMAPLVYQELSRWMNKDEASLRQEAEFLLEKQGFGPWSAVAGICGTRRQLRDVRRHIRRRLHGIARVVFLDDFLISAATTLTESLSFVPWFRRKQAVLKATIPFYGLARGRPTDAAMNSVYWPIGLPPPLPGANPDQSDCGLLFCVPFIPADGRMAEDAVHITERIYEKHGFVPYITINLVDGKSVECVINMAFDRSIKERAVAAHACNDELTETFIKNGFPPYRLGVQSMGLIVDEGSTYWQTLRKIKNVLDPNNIIAPGRYSLP